MGHQKEKKQTGLAGSGRYALFAVAVLGVLLLAFGDHIPALMSGNGNGSEGDAVTEGGATDELALYAAALTEQIEQLCSTVRGAGSVRAAVSLQGGFTYLYAADRESRQDEGEMLQTSESYITVGNGSGEQAVLLTKVPPEIRGIGIVCEGGENAAVRSEILSLLSAAYDIGSNRIYVTQGDRAAFPK